MACGRRLHNRQATCKVRAGEVADKLSHLKRWLRISVQSSAVGPRIVARARGHQWRHGVVRSRRG